MIKIIIAEDQGMLRGALGSLLDLEEDMEVVAQVQNGAEALDMIHVLQPDICLMDIEMPIKSGLEVAEELKRRRSNCRTIILTTFARPGYFERAVKAEVHGYLLKDGPVDGLTEAIRHVMKGNREFSPELIFGSFKDENPLTERERDVLKMVAEGLSTREVAGQLFLSHGTVRNYMSEIINKLQVKNRIEAISVAEEKGWI